MQRPKKIQEKKVNPDSLERKSLVSSTHPKSLPKPQPSLSDDVKHSDRSLAFLEHKIAPKAEDSPYTVEQDYQKAIEFLYNAEYIAAFRLFSQLAAHQEEKYKQIKWESCLFKVQILAIFREFKEALKQIDALKKDIEASSTTSKLDFEIQLAVYQALLLVCTNKANDAQSAIQGIEDEIPFFFTQLIQFFIDNDAQSTESALRDKIQKSKFIDYWMEAAEARSIECIVLNGLYLWLGLILVAKEQYSLSEYYFKRIIPITYQFDAQEQKHQIYPLDSVEVSYETHLQLLLNKIKKNEFKEFINMVEKERNYVDRDEIIWSKICWLSQDIGKIDDGDISQYAGLTSNSLDLIKQSHDSEIVTKFYHQVMTKFSTLFAHLYIHQYNNKFKGYSQSLDQHIHESDGDRLLFSGDFPHAAIEYGKATDEKNSADSRIAARAHFKRYAISYVQSLPQLNRDSIRKQLDSYEDKDYFNCVEFMNLISQTGMELTKFDSNQTKIPEGYKAICLQWLGIILFYKKEYPESIRYFDKLIEEFSTDDNIVLANLYQARAYAKLGEEKECHDIFSKLIKHKREDYGLKHHDLQAVQIECDYHLAVKVNNLKCLIKAYHELTLLKQTIKDEYNIHQYHYFDFMYDDFKRSIVDHLSDKIITTLDNQFQKEPSTLSVLKKSKDVNFEKKWREAVLNVIQGYFNTLIKYDFSENLTVKLYELYKHKWDDKTKEHIKQIFAQFIKQQTEVKTVMPESTPTGLSKKDLFKESLARELEDGFTHSKSYANGFVPDTSFDATNKVKLLATAASFLPLGETVSKSCVGISLFVGIAGDIYNLLKIEQAKEMSERVLKLLPPGYRSTDISYFCDSVSVTISDIYATQIEKLSISQAGIPLFAKQAATIMLWYIATDEGRRSSLLNIGDKIREYSLITIASLLKVSVPKEETRNGVSKMVVGLFFTPLARKTSERLLLATDEKTVDQTNPWTGEGILRRTAINVNDRIYILPGITQFKKYGGIKAPTGLSEDWLRQQQYQQVAKGCEDGDDELKEKNSSCFVM